jgi:hypothetical protein
MLLVISIPVQVHVVLKLFSVLSEPLSNADTSAMLMFTMLSMLILSNNLDITYFQSLFSCPMMFSHVKCGMMQVLLQC